MRPEVAALLLVACAPPAPDAPDAPDIDAALVFDLPLPDLRREPLSLWATYYYVPLARHEPTGFPLRAMDGAALGVRLAHRAWCDAAMEGTVRVELGDGTVRTFNYAGTGADLAVDCTPFFPRHRAIGRSRFTLARGPHGDGVQGMVLVPYRSIAVDPTTIAFGSVIFIPRARGTGIDLPSGQRATHDGFFFAADRGGAIRGNHIDVFVGAGPNPFRFVGRGNFDAYLIGDAGEPATRLRDAHFP